MKFLKSLLFLLVFILNSNTRAYSQPMDNYCYCYANAKVGETLNIYGGKYYGIISNVQYAGNIYSRSNAAIQWRNYLEGKFPKLRIDDLECECSLSRNEAIRERNYRLGQLGDNLSDAGVYEIRNFDLAEWNVRDLPKENQKTFSKSKQNSPKDWPELNKYERLRAYPILKTKYPSSKPIIEESDRQVKTGKESINETIDFIIRQSIASREGKEKVTLNETSGVAYHTRSFMDFIFDETIVKYVLNDETKITIDGRKYPGFKRVGLYTFNLLDMDANSISIVKYKLWDPENKGKLELISRNLKVLKIKCKSRNCVKLEPIEATEGQKENSRESSVWLAVGYQDDLLKLKRTYDHLFKMINPSKSSNIVNASKEDFWGKTKNKKN